MKTLRLSVDPEDLDSQASRAAIGIAAAILQQGGLVSFPTETVYGLGANALDPAAVEKIFAAKQRPAWDPLIVHVSGRTRIAAVADDAAMTASATRLMDRFWPGPLTLLLPKADAVPAIVTAGRPLVGVRVPSHPVAHALLVAAGIPIAAPSANRFGRISPTLATHVIEDLDGRIDAVLDSGETLHGLESTVVDASQEPVIVYRPGAISLEAIRQVCDSAIQWTPLATAEIDHPESLPSPGLGVRHYAPRATLVLISGEGAQQASAFLNAIKNAVLTYDRVGIMLPSHLLANGIAQPQPSQNVFDWGDWRDPEQLAHRLFAGLRSLDAAGVRVILCPMPSASGIGAAIRDRLLKAAKE